MTGKIPINRAWPGPVVDPLDHAGLAALYGRPGLAGLRVNFVTSIDGAVTLDGYSEGLSGEPDKRVFDVLRMLCDALLVGAGTLRHEGYGPLRLGDRQRAWRREQGLDEQPTLVVVSGSLRLDPALPAFTEAPVRPLVLTHEQASAPPGLTDVADLLRYGTDVVDLGAGLAELRRRGLRQLLCEGGPVLFGTLTAADLVDEVCLTVAPLLTGPGAGRITAGLPCPPRPMALKSVLTSGDGMLLLRYTRE